MMPTKDTQQIAQLSALCTCDAIGMARRPSTTSSYVIAAPAARVGEKAEKFAEVAGAKNLRIDGRVEIDLPGAGGGARGGRAVIAKCNSISHDDLHHDLHAVRPNRHNTF